MNVNANAENGPPPTYRLYTKRWVVLAVVAMLNLSNALAWIAFSPVANYAGEFYGGNKDAASDMAIAFMLATTLFGLSAMYAESTWGLKTAILTSAWVNCASGAIRLTSSFLPLSYRYTVGIGGQVVGGMATAFIMFLPSKVAAVWFEQEMTGLATTIALMCNPLAVLGVNLLLPSVITATAHVPYINIATGVLALAVAIAATALITSSAPPTPPSHRATQPSPDFFPALGTCLSNGQYLVLLVVVGGGIGLSSTLFLLMQQLLCPAGYSSTFSGVISALTIGGGIVGGICAGFFIDWTQLYKETMKVCITLAVLLGLVFLQLALYPGLHSWIYAITCLFGFFGMAAYPVGLELAAECTFPITEAISVGLIVIVGQVMAILFTFIMRIFSTENHAYYAEMQSCTTGGIKSYSNWTMSTYVLTGIALVILALLIFVSDPPYTRLLQAHN